MSNDKCTCGAMSTGGYCMVHNPTPKSLKKALQKIGGPDLNFETGVPYEIPPIPKLHKAGCPYWENHLGEQLGVACNCGAVPTPNPEDESFFEEIVHASTPKPTGAQVKAGWKDWTVIDERDQALAERDALSKLCEMLAPEKVTQGALAMGLEISALKAERDEWRDRANRNALNAIADQDALKAELEEEKRKFELFNMSCPSYDALTAENRRLREALESVSALKADYAVFDIEARRIARKALESE
jgi:hypothetical protein